MTDGRALVYCEGFFNTPWGKTAHGLVRFTRRYDVAAVIDSRYAGQDAGMVLDHKPAGIPIFSDIDIALKADKPGNKAITHLVFGIATDAGKLTEEMKKDILHAVELGLHVDCGMHFFLSDDPSIFKAAQKSGSIIRDIRKTPPRHELHGYTGRIKEVESFRIALLGTDSAVGKRTTAWKLVEAFNTRGIKAELIGTGQTAWLQGALYGVIMDSLINDFVAGEIENAILEAWEHEHPQVMVIEGQGSLMNPLYPGGFEILSAGQPHSVVMQHAPTRKDYDGIPGSPIHPLAIQIQAVELLSGKPVTAITINHEGMKPDEIDLWCNQISEKTGLPVKDALIHNLNEIVDALLVLKQKM
ncbi:MAG: DUF1611 domain-containing protein [Spirochaetales bacterium]|jgi:uncharacterized NAD-dependent epimerase/dehydratase family protein|nr:DUF1611 domain-containing protein [Spirochaetales bacterium]